MHQQGDAFGKDQGVKIPQRIPQIVNGHECDHDPLLTLLESTLATVLGFSTY